MDLPGRTDDHQWSQRHLSHYVDGALSRRPRHRLSRHARDCVDCGRGILAMRALVYIMQGLDGLEGIRAPAGIFDRVRRGEVGGSPGGGSAAPAPNA
jgi:Putative zinc-finger